MTASAPAKFSAGSVSITSNPGSAGVDHSVNPPTWPLAGANFPTSDPTNPYSGYVLIQTIAADANRANIEVWNSSGNFVLVLRDDGTAANGAALTNASCVVLAGGAQNADGSYWQSKTFKGRVQIFSQDAAAYVSVFTD